MFGYYAYAEAAPSGDSVVDVVVSLPRSWTAATLTTEWATYRQALRDITLHSNFSYLLDDDWPVKPN
jgi:hypothetical protein